MIINELFINIIKCKNNLLKTTKIGKITSNSPKVLEIIIYIFFLSLSKSKPASTQQRCLRLHPHQFIDYLHSEERKLHFSELHHYSIKVLKFNS